MRRTIAGIASAALAVAGLAIAGTTITTGSANAAPGQASGQPYACDAVVATNDPKVVQIAEKLGIALPEIGLAGLNCSNPTGEGGEHPLANVLCTGNNNFGGLIILGCEHIDPVG
ncbi:hydrophobin family protein [Amycolatopsis sp. DSM 110486]|uniref:hydrophobin family protein n=1 Tax=Amycolatopsis sp. DSM 110486 TaxID=2865832 RepID=UPI001C69C701|nr:hydrophobin family protein [Amycolatopsis sp. DSM 110486]QYN17563.1 hypothetical protein K1T34_32780 [Amycolatopsis sp. DSM 110486]